MYPYELLNMTRCTEMVKGECPTCGTPLEEEQCGAEARFAVIGLTCEPVLWAECKKHAAELADEKEYIVVPLKHVRKLKTADAFTDELWEQLPAVEIFRDGKWTPIFEIFMCMAQRDGDKNTWCWREPGHSEPHSYDEL